MKNRNYTNFALALLVLATTVNPTGAQSTYEPYTFTTLAGTAGQGSADGTGSAARFNNPIGLALDSAGNLYVADTSNNTIRKVAPTGLVTTIAGLAGTQGSADGTGNAARFNAPCGVGVDTAANVYVADRSNNTIRKLTPAGLVTTLAGVAQFDANGNPVGGRADGTGSAARFNQPRSVAVDSAGNLYVADESNNAVRKVTPAGVVTTLAGLAQFDDTGYPVGGSADGTGTVARFNRPLGVGVDSAGNVYVADSGNFTIRKITPVGVVTTLGKSGDSAPLVFGEAPGVGVDSTGNIYVTLYEGVIKRVTAAGELTILAGTNYRFGSADGTGSDARFNFGPGAGVVADNAGNVYVADTGNNTIRKGYPALVITSSGPNFAFNGGLFGFDLTGPAGKLVVVEASTDLVSWLPIWTNSFASALNFSDPQSNVYSNRFYRAHTP